MKNKLLVIYVGIQGVRLEDIEYFVKTIIKRIAPSTLKAEIIAIPTQSPDTRVECIDPKYITDADLINEHTEMLKKLQEELQHQTEQLKEENNG